MYRTPTIPDFSCLCHAVKCLLLVILGHSVIIGQLPWCCVPDYLSQLCYGPVVTYCMVYHYTKRAVLARLLANKGLAIYVVHLNRYFVISL